MQSPPPPVPPLAGRRADAGTVKLTGRDITGLMLCAEHFAAPYDLLAAALDVRGDRLRGVLEMPPFLAWFRGRETVGAFLAARALAAPGRWRAIPVWANGQPAMGAYLRQDDGRHHAHSVQVFDVTDGSLTWIAAFQEPGLFATFGLPLIYPADLAERIWVRVARTIGRSRVSVPDGPVPPGRSRPAGPARPVLRGRFCAAGSARPVLRGRSYAAGRQRTPSMLPDRTAGPAEWGITTVLPRPIMRDEPSSVARWPPPAVTTSTL